MSAARAFLLALAAGTSLPSAVSPEGCAPCHGAETQSIAAAGMTRALSRPGNTGVLTAKLGSYQYRLEHSTLTVSNGTQSLTAPIEWAFGHGTVGQTYVFRLEGRWYESRVSWYSSVRGLDLTIGMQNLTPHNLVEAAGRLASPSEMGQCFDCHATGVIKSPTLQLDAMREGIQCERCHGPSEAHLRAVRGAASPSPAMRKLGALSTEEMSDFCGQCHRTWSQIAAGGPHGIQNIRFQPYRLANSRCYDAADSRIRCTACHDPHRDLETSAPAYDARCLACHSAAARQTKASRLRCRVGTRECVTCHMPRLELPGAHRRFTDHRIRIARSGERYPD